MLTSKDISQIKNKLISQKKEIEQQLQAFADKDENIKHNYKARFPDYGRKAEDNAEEFESYENAVALEHQLEQELKKINIALDKIINGKDYGACEKCGATIKPERLKARPQAQKCLQCKKG
ncbi:MAG: hypothetical protein GF332_04370 [Candidatus Moranbacteria bacterium]|nr:hypothetical protein [Candidatus Moranbacteria bacterium]